MLIIDYQKKYQSKIIHACVLALKQGKVLAYATDTSYGFAVDAQNQQAVTKLYKVKGRDFKKPIHVVVPSIAYAKRIADFSLVAQKLAKKFWPGPLTLVLKVKDKKLNALTSGTNFIGLRMPNSNLALGLAKKLGRPITATSANLSGQPDSYSATTIIEQFQKQKFQPDIVINAGRLPKTKPSTVVKVDGKQLEILRKGPIKFHQILLALK